jgi:mannose-6-phosphate isomerase-like protein (cupin superfamily)
MIHLFNNAERLPTPFEAYRLLQSEQLELINIELKGGEDIPLHQNSLDVIFIILGGSGIISIEDRCVAVGPKDLIEVPKGVQRSILNQATDILSILVIKKMTSQN